jgi:hypothetical protein
MLDLTGEGMTKAEQTRLMNLSRKQGFETLSKQEAKELARLAAKQALELKAAKHPTRKRR